MRKEDLIQITRLVGKFPVHGPGTHGQAGIESLDLLNKPLVEITRVSGNHLVYIGSAPGQPFFQFRGLVGKFCIKPAQIAAGSIDDLAKLFLFAVHFA